VPQHSKNMRLGNLIWSRVSQDVIISIARLVIWNMSLPTGEWIQMWLVGGTTTSLRKASHVRHLVGGFRAISVYSIFGEVHGVGQGGYYGGTR
jgi:hypothetical protein